MSKITAEFPPTFSLTHKDLPEAKDWEVGKTYRLEVTVEQIATYLDEFHDEEPVRSEFRITKVKPYEDEPALRGNKV